MSGFWSGFLAGGVLGLMVGIILMGLYVRTLLEEQEQ